METTLDRLLDGDFGDMPLADDLLLRAPGEQTRGVNAVRERFVRLFDLGREHLSRVEHLRTSRDEAGPTWCVEGSAYFVTAEAMIALPIAVVGLGDDSGRLNELAVYFDTRPFGQDKRTSGKADGNPTTGAEDETIARLIDAAVAADGESIEPLLTGDVVVHQSIGGHRTHAGKVNAIAHLRKPAIRSKDEHAPILRTSAPQISVIRATTEEDAARLIVVRRREGLIDEIRFYGWD